MSREGTTWRTKDGVVLDIKRMTDIHLRNTIMLLERWWTPEAAHVLVRFHYAVFYALFGWNLPQGCYAEIDKISLQTHTPVRGEFVREAS